MPLDPVATVERNAVGKVEEVVERVPAADDQVVLGVDTVVVLDEHILGKVDAAPQAAACLRRLAGRSHDVVSGLCLRQAQRVYVGHCVTRVTFRALHEEAVERYVASGEWRERAGAYAIQGLGSALVAAVDGDYFNVVGLPVSVLAEALQSLDLPCFGWTNAATT